MNWIWDLRSRDGGMNGPDLARCTTAGGFPRVPVHAAPGQLQPHLTADDGTIVRGDADSEIWPNASHPGLPVLLPGGEVGC